MDRHSQLRNSRNSDSGLSNGIGGRKPSYTSAGPPLDSRSQREKSVGRDKSQGREPRERGTSVRYSVNRSASDLSRSGREDGISRRMPELNRQTSSVSQSGAPSTQKVTVLQRQSSVLSQGGQSVISLKPGPSQQGTGSTWYRSDSTVATVTQDKERRSLRNTKSLSEEDSSDDDEEPREAWTQVCDPAEHIKYLNGTNGKRFIDDPGRYPPDKPVGYRNMGNTCYLNSIMQMLTYCPAMWNYCIRGADGIPPHQRRCWYHHEKAGDCAFCLQCDHTKNVKDSEEGRRSIIPIFARDHGTLSNVSKTLKWGRQEDAHEFLRLLLDALTKCFFRGRRVHIVLENTTYVQHVFGGWFQSCVECCVCNRKSRRFDFFMDLCLEIERHTTSITDALKTFTNPEFLDDDNKYRCKQCKRPQRASKRLLIHECPRYLTVQLKRFNQDGILAAGKITKHIQFGEDLDLSPYCSERRGCSYRLYGVVVHEGQTMRLGHYYSYVRPPGSKMWWCCNDDHVSAVHLKDVLDSQAYLLFYERVTDPEYKGKGKQFPRPQKPAPTSPGGRPDLPKPGGPPPAPGRSDSRKDSSGSRNERHKKMFGMQIFSLDPVKCDLKADQLAFNRVPGCDRRQDYDDYMRHYRDDDGDSDRSRSRSPAPKINSPRRRAYAKWDADFDQIIWDQSGIGSPTSSVISGNKKQELTTRRVQPKSTQPLASHSASSRSSIIGQFIGPKQPSREQTPASSSFIGPALPPSTEKTNASQASQETANSDLAAEFEKDLMDDDDPPMPSSSAASSGSAFGYGKSSFNKQTGGKPRFGNSVLARNSVDSGSGSRSRSSSVIGPAPRQAPHSRAVIHNSGYAESPDHSRSRSRTRSHSQVAQRYRNAAKSPAAPPTHGLHRRTPPTDRRNSREKSSTRSGVPKRRSITPARDPSPVSGPLGNGDGPKERTIKSFSFNTQKGPKVIAAAGKSKNGIASQLIAKPKNSAPYQDTQMAEGGDIPMQNPGKPASKASFGADKSLQLNRMPNLLGAYRNDDIDSD